MRRIKWQFLSIISPVLFCQHVHSVCWITILPIACLTDSTGFWQFALLNRVSACSLSVFDSTWYNASNWTFVESKKEIVRTGELKQKWMPWQVPHWGTQTCRPHPFSVLTIQPSFVLLFGFISEILLLTTTKKVETRWLRQIVECSQEDVYEFVVPSLLPPPPSAVCLSAAQC